MLRFPSQQVIQVAQSFLQTCPCECFPCNWIIFHCNDGEDDDDWLFYVSDCFVMLTMQCSGMSGLLIKSQQKGQILEQSVNQRHCFVVVCVIWVGGYGWLAWY